MIITLSFIFSFIGARANEIFSATAFSPTSECLRDSHRNVLQLRKSLNRCTLKLTLFYNPLYLMFELG
jgi:hypothetical protein